MRPAPGLGQRVGLRVPHVELGDGVQVRIVQAVAAVVLIGQLAEHVRPHVLGVLALVTDPRSRAEVAGRGVPRDVPLLLDGDHQHAVVAAGLDVGHGRQHGHAARGAGRLVPGGRLAPQVRLDGGGHRPELSLPGEELAERVPDVNGFDVLRPRHRHRPASPRPPRRPCRRSPGPRARSYARSRSGSCQRSRRSGCSCLRPSRAASPYATTEGVTQPGRARRAESQE